MSTILIFLLTICELNVLKCSAVDSSVISSNQIEESSDLEAEIPVDTNVILEDDVYPDPLSSVNFDYLNNALVFQFLRNPKNVERDEFEARRRSALDKNFMRFGRTGLMRFGKKRQAETTYNLSTDNNNDPNIRLGRSESTTRDSRGDSFMRFGRTGLKRGGSLMRFGRADNMMRFGRADNMMRFGRADHMMRFGRADNMMRFGRQQPAQNPMRFGRSDNGLMRFGRGDSFMRFGRNPSFAKTSEAVSRTGNELLNDDIYLKVSTKSEPNLMRFGKRNKELVVPSSENSTNTPNTPADNPSISKQVLDYLFSDQSKTDSQETEDDELVESTLSSRGIDNRRFSKSGVHLPANDGN